MLFTYHLHIFHPLSTIKMTFLNLFLICTFKEQNLTEKRTNLAENLFKSSTPRSSWSLFFPSLNWANSVWEIWDSGHFNQDNSKGNDIHYLIWSPMNGKINQGIDFPTYEVCFIKWENYKMAFYKNLSQFISHFFGVYLVTWKKPFTEN